MYEITGTGRVGSAVLQTLLEQSEILGSRFGLNISILGKNIRMHLHTVHAYLHTHLMFAHTFSRHR